MEFVGKMPKPFHFESIQKTECHLNCFKLILFDNMGLLLPYPIHYIATV